MLVKIIITILAVLAFCGGGVADHHTLADWYDVREKWGMEDRPLAERLCVMGPVLAWEMTEDYQLILEDGLVDLETLEVICEV